MRHYILDHAKAFHERADVKIEGVIFDQHGEFVTNTFNTGKSLGQFTYKIKIQPEFSQPGKLRDKLWVRINRSSVLFVGSPGVIEVLKEFDAQALEFLDVEICAFGSIIRDYKIINVLKRIDCINDEESELVYYTDSQKVYAIDKLVLDESRISSGCDIFQLDRTEKNVTVVSQLVVDKIEAEGLTGFTFMLPAEFSIG